MEEAKALVCWEAIKDHLRNEEHNRSSEESGSSTPLDSLNDEQLLFVREKYDKFTPYIRISFVAMAMLAVLWDVMLMVRIKCSLVGLRIPSCISIVCIISGNRQQSYTSIQLPKNLSQASFLSCCGSSHTDLFSIDAC